MNKKVLSEELKRYRQLLEYTFYVPENEKDVNGNLLTDDQFITEQDPAGEAEDDPFMSVGGDETSPEAGAETPETPETPETDPLSDDAEVEDVVADETDTATETPETSTETDDGSVEIDVTDIVDKTEATKTSVEGMSSKMDELLNKLSELESQVSGMDNVINKIDDLEKEPNTC
jgi:hypothetical protein